MLSSRRSRLVTDLFKVAALFSSISTVFTATPCNSIRVSNTMWQSSMEGVYTQYQGNGCVAGTTVWANQGQGIFIYYVNLAKYSAWIIGPGLCTDIASIFATSFNYQYPYSSDLSGQWFEVDYIGNPSSNSYLTVTCADGSALSVGAIAGIMIASISALILLLVIIVCCCTVHNNKRNRIRGVDPRSTANAVDVGSSDYHRHLDETDSYRYPPEYGPPLVAPGQWAMNVLPVQAPRYEDVYQGGPPSPPPAYYAVQSSAGLPTVAQSSAEHTINGEPSPESPGRASRASVAVGPPQSMSIGGGSNSENETSNPTESPALTPV